MATNEETYDQPLAMTTTNIFEVNHEDAYDSDVDEGPNAAHVTDPPPANSTVMPAPRKKLDSEFNDEENKLEMADTQAEIILSQGLPRHIFNILIRTSTAKEIWDNAGDCLCTGSVSTHQQPAPETHAMVHDGQIVTEPIQRKAPGNVGNTGVRGKKVQRQKVNMLQMQEETGHVA
ncbi:hypothetical protein Tco_1548489 [Tanacetum coccineum]